MEEKKVTTYDLWEAVDLIAGVFGVSYLEFSFEIGTNNEDKFCITLTLIKNEKKKEKRSR